MPDRFAIGPLVEGIEAGSRPAIARAITLVESGRPDHRARARELLAAIAPRTGGAVRLGISGIPGAGKSTFIDALGVRLVDAGHRVAVLAVDPSSSRTGGSILGDRTRMAQLAVRDEAFVRPSPSGGHLGGVARATRESMLVLEAAGFDTIVVETVGVGQSEVAVAGMVDTFLLLLIARSGDSLQGIKRGIVEIADLIAVNKADGEHEAEARRSARELDGALRLMNTDGRRRPLVLTCSALTGAGLDEVWEKVTAHRDRLEADGVLESRRAAQQLDWMWAMTDAALAEAVRTAPGVARVRARVEADVAAGRIGAADGTARLLAALAADVPGLGWADGAGET
ncbi:methylmalonyl Co-A mutase-associated GTPase MeaB [Agilicoccus flavus]|uniref:methylmalonyl Co-A mutase-associated GTPase MeaB n=1 Tax=Agilicoccus flavus TaxID=2775968 RepID=UPI001CF6BBFA|nr:methylmalonyl Co-A mutase-associated GTPase MeaB [Agilicoccus flavus]